MIIRKPTRGKKKKKKKKKIKEKETKKDSSVQARSKQQV